MLGTVYNCHTAAANTAAAVVAVLHRGTAASAEPVVTAAAVQPLHTSVKSFLHKGKCTASF
jgi:hypothetical protein